eukprot:CAMPEP_0119106162 /NCGR_PEP_ID=MMETSP1180-20130426/3928_1 /TAXON_ID=3052 ORGANISM="Chlamydomonas cf sp, Strain CCMP681" /NCGR_SAMPLE_ID=MMETSP1180 /ASSEMBLY_ACC=CAM_ASM_000741 /LENGTH=144 /DNA_ID=CAMNT_0007091417 /DNA_START=64 /DNA_END=498 /DNA_ORIENTATION=+
MASSAVSMRSMSAQQASQVGRPKVARRLAVSVTARAAKSAVKGKAAAMVCIDCGYLYDGKLGPFEELGAYNCPVCGANKKRFRAFDGSVSRGNDNKTMAARQAAITEQLAEKGESVGEDLTTLIVSGGFALAVLGALFYFATNR